MESEKNQIDGTNYDDLMMPGFRFHPTDEELVGFYLKRKIQQRPLPIDLIKQLDIYKYDPWDLPKLAATSGEKEWYFYCPRDRKYRNSARPNRVTGSGFWKATGTDRPIYSCHGTKCIGLKKSLVFYRGRAAKGIKTDWMMHEFRLPSLGGDHPPPKKLLDKSLPPNDAWAICRIFKKINSMAQRALSNSCIPPFGDSTPSNILPHQFNSENFSCTTEIGPIFHLSSINDNLLHPQAFSTLDMPTSCRPINSTLYKPSLPVSNGRVGDLQDNYMFSPTKSTTFDTSSMLLNPTIIGEVNNESNLHNFKGSPPENFNGFSISLSRDGIQNNLGLEEVDVGFCKVSSSIPKTFPFNLPSGFPDVWKPNMPWDSPPCPSEISTSYSTNICYT